MEKTQFGKMVVAEKFAEVARILSNVKAPQEVIDFVVEKGEQAQKRNANRKPSQSKTNKEKLAEMQKMQEWFFEEADPETFYTRQEVNEALEFVYNPQKMTPRVKGLVEQGGLEKGIATSDKKKGGYKII